VADCAGCHTSWHGHTNPALYGGGNEIVRGKTKAFSTNLTRDPSGIPYYDDALFIEVMRTGHVKARELSPLMPWVVYRNLSDDDLRAIFTFLSAGPRSRTTSPITSRPRPAPPAARSTAGGDRTAPRRR
jgi:nicotinate dehydrogenase subunit B